LCFFRSPFDMVYVRGDSVPLAVVAASRQTVIVPADNPFASGIIDLVFDMLDVDARVRPFIGDVLKRVQQLIDEDNGRL
jgi:serine/threonine kinase 16